MWAVRGMRMSDSRLVALFALALTLAAASPLAVFAQAAQPAPVVVIDLEGEISEGMPNAVRRAVREASEIGASHLVVRIQTFGGLVSSAAAIRDELLASPVPVVAFVDSRAISAGALIALSSERIYMAPGGSIGAATPYQQRAGDQPSVDEKMVSALRSMFRATAEARGHRRDLAEAMVDPDVAIEGVIDAGKLLTLTSEEAVELGLAAGQASGLHELASGGHISSGEQVWITLSPAERLADFLSRPHVAGLLLSIGIWALIFAFKMPGTGLPEVVAVLAIGSFLFGKHIAGLAGWEEFALVGVGAALLAVEIFVLPGLGIAGILGVLAMGAGLVMAAIGHAPSSPLFAAELTRAITMLGIAIGLAIAWSAGAYFALRNTPLWKRFTMRSALDPSDGAEATELALTALAGQTGTAKTSLRPEGEVEIAGQTYPARAEHGYLEEHAPIAVVSHVGRRLVVRAADDGAAEAADETSGDPS
jgi:membrane-bound serine protease (ClpP class)